MTVRLSFEVVCAVDGRFYSKRKDWQYISERLFVIVSTPP